MKLIVASTALFATLQAQTIENLVTDLLNKVYQVSDDGLSTTLNFAPYFEATYRTTVNSYDEPTGFTSEGSIGNGNGVFEFTEHADWSGESASYYYAASGYAKSHPAAAFFPAHVLNDKFDCESKLEVNTEELTYKQTGYVNDDYFSQEFNVGLDSVQITNKKYAAEISFSRKIVIPSSINQFWRSMMIPEGETELKMEASARRACDNPVDRSCTAKIVITGSNDGLDFGNNVARYSVSKKKAQLTVTHNSNEVFWLGLLGIDDFEVFTLKCKINGGKPILVVQIFGPEGLEPVQIAGGKFIAPFLTFFSHMSGDDAAHAIAYMDKVFAAIQGQGYFNVYPIIKATQFESDLLADAFGVKSVQSAAKQGCEQVNLMIEGYAQSAAPAIETARSYVNDVTGSAGEARFDSWFSGLAEE